MQLNCCIGEAEWITNVSYECARQRKKSELWKRYFASYTHIYLLFAPTLIDKLCEFILSDSIGCNIESTQNGNQLNKMSIISFVLLSDNEYNLVKDYCFVNVECTFLINEHF